MIKISVIIVTIGIKDYLKICLDSLVKQVHPADEIIVIDNSLKSRLAQEARKAYPLVKIYSSPENLFYGRALNKGIDISYGDFILCLNDDVILDKDFIRNALSGFLIDDRIGSVSGKIMRSDGKTLDSTGLLLSPWRTAKERGYGKQDTGMYNKAGFVFGVSGAAAFYRKAMLESVKDKYGYFDSRFGMFYEDLDIAWRAEKKRWKTCYVPDALAYHVRGGSFRPESGIGKPIARRYLNGRLHHELIKNRYLTILKNEIFFGFILYFIPILMYDLLAWSYIFFCRRELLKSFFLFDAKGRC